MGNLIPGLPLTLAEGVTLVSMQERDALVIPTCDADGKKVFPTGKEARAKLAELFPERANDANLDFQWDSRGHIAPDGQYVILEGATSVYAIVHDDKAEVETTDDWQTRSDKKQHLLQSLLDAQDIDLDLGAAFVTFSRAKRVVRPDTTVAPPVKSATA
jgi:hypothetical protein